MKNSQIIIRIFIVAITMLALPSLAPGQSIEGDWYGKASFQGIELRLNLHIKPSGDGYTSTWDSPDQGAMDIPSSTTTFIYPDFTFSHDGAGFKYAGKVDPAYTAISGTLFQGGQKFDIQFARTQIEPPRGSTEALKLKYTKKEVYITMRDGVKLFTSIYAPKDTLNPHPVLINRTPYGIEPGGAENFNFFMQVYSRYPEAGYIMVFQDVRGRFMSEGAFEDIRPVNPERKNSKDIDESTDTWDTVDWLIKNVAGNNGKVGIFGISYPGFYSTMGLIGAHPAVKAVSPQAPVASWFVGDDMHHNGAFYLLDCFGFFYSNGQVFRSPSRRGFPRFTFPTKDAYDFFLSLGAIKNISPKYLGDSVKFWNDAFSHPDYDNFWKARDPRQYLKNVTPAVMTVGGWFDAEDLYGALHTYKSIEKQNPPSVRNTLVMGPWSHGQWAFGEGTNLGNIYWGLNANERFAEVEKKFFDYYLKGEGTEDFPEALVFVTGENRWQDFKTWPPENTVQKSLCFQSSGALTFGPATVKASFDEYVSDPMKPVPYSETVGTSRTTEYMTDDQRFAAKRPDVMVYQTDILSDDITLTGPITADLFVSTTGTDADYVVKLIDVFPNDTQNPEGDKVKVPLAGYQMLVRGEVFRGRYRNSFEKPEAFIPGKVTGIKYEMPDVAHTFKKGHRIMVQVQNSWFPLVDRNPQKFVDIYKCSDTDFQKATHRIYHDSKYPSCLKINVLQ
jgi:putative CocE/NonD family hydrolase